MKRFVDWEFALFGEMICIELICFDSKVDIVYVLKKKHRKLWKMFDFLVLVTKVEPRADPKTPTFLSQKVWNWAKKKLILVLWRTQSVTENDENSNRVFSHRFRELEVPTISVRYLRNRCIETGGISSTRQAILKKNIFQKWNQDKECGWHS